MDSKQLQQLKSFVDLCKKTPSVLHSDELQFYRDYLTSLGATIPPKPEAHSHGGHHEHGSGCSHEAHGGHGGHAPPPASAQPAAEPESEESDIDIDREGVVEPDHDAPQEMGDDSMEVTDELMEKSSEFRDQAMSATAEGNLEEAIRLYTEAIKANPSSAVLYAKRASIYIKLKKPNAAIRDCNKALDLNPDSSAGYKWRGLAHKLLGDWQEANNDLATCCKIDYDEEANVALKDVTPKAKRMIEHKRKHDRHKEERELNERKERIRIAKEEHEKARKEEEQRQKEARNSGGFSFGGGSPFGAGAGGSPFGAGAGGSPFGGGAAGAGGMPDLASLLQDPDILQAFQDPEVAQAFADISQNPANIMKYQNNPKVQALIAKMSSKFEGKFPSSKHKDSFDEDKGPKGGSGAEKPSSGFEGVPQPDID